MVPVYRRKHKILKNTFNTPDMEQQMNPIQQNLIQESIKVIKQYEEIFSKVIDPDGYIPSVQIEDAVISRKNHKKFILKLMGDCSVTQAMKPVEHYRIAICIAVVLVNKANCFMLYSKDKASGQTMAALVPFKSDNRRMLDTRKIEFYPDTSALGSGIDKYRL